MSISLMAIIMLIIVIILIFSKKIPMVFILAVVPIIFAKLLGFPMDKIGIASLNQISIIMKASGYMLLFALMYFTMLSETGMFEILINKLLTIFKIKSNIWSVMILTTLVAGIGSLSASPTSAYLITFPMLMPLYNKLGFDKRAAMIIAQTVIAAMSFLPWGMVVSTAAVFSGMEPIELTKYCIPLAICFIPGIIFQWIYFYRRYNKDKSKEISNSEVNIVNKEINPNSKPEKFVINFIVFILTIITLGFTNTAPYIIFIFSSLVTLLINYPTPKEYQPIWAKSSSAFYVIILMLIGIGVFLGVFKETGMLTSVANSMVNVFPSFLMRYAHIILLGLCVVIVRFIPYQVFLSLMPILIGIGNNVGINPAYIAAPFALNLVLGTGSSAYNSTTHVGVGLLGIDLEKYLNLATPVQQITNIIVMGTALLFGVIK